MECWRYALVEHVGHAVGDDPGLARARARDDEEGAVDGGDGLVLLGIELCLRSLWALSGGSNLFHEDGEGADAESHDEAHDDAGHEDAANDGEDGALPIHAEYPGAERPRSRPR